jgi:hypothetical protein
MAVNMFSLHPSSSGPFCAREEVSFQIINTDDLAPQVVVISSNETVIPSNGFTLTGGGRNRTISVPSSAHVSPGWTDVTIMAVDNRSRQAKYADALLDPLEA